MSGRKATLGKHVVDVELAVLQIHEGVQERQQRECAVLRFHQILDFFRFESQALAAGSHRGFQFRGREAVSAVGVDDAAERGEQGVQAAAPDTALEQGPYQPVANRVAIWAVRGLGEEPGWCVAKVQVVGDG